MIDAVLFGTGLSSAEQVDGPGECTQSHADASEEAQDNLAECLDATGDVLEELWLLLDGFFPALDERDLRAIWR